MIQQTNAVKVVGQVLRRILKDKPVPFFQMALERIDDLDCIRSGFKVKFGEVDMEVAVFVHKRTNFADSCWFLYSVVGHSLMG